MASNQFLSPVGRLLQGDAFVPQTKNQQGAPLVVQSGPNAGQPTQKYFIAVGFKKGDPATEQFIASLRGVARGAWPQWHDAAGNCTHPRFSSKIMDGDGVDDNGKPNASKEGFAGHWVVKFSSSYPPKVYHTGNYRPDQILTDAKLVQRGYFVRVAGTVEGNGNTAKPGLYVNLNMVELCAQGPVIQTGPDAAAVFGAAAPMLPQGATPMPAAALAPQPMPMAAPMQPQPVQMPMAAPVAVQPNHGFVQGPVAMPTPVPMPVAAPVRQMTAAAGGYTYEQLIAGGWTDATLREKGLMI